MERYMILIRTDGTGRLIRCDDGDTCKLETLQQLVGGLIETVCELLEIGQEEIGELFFPEVEQNKKPAGAENTGGLRVKAI